MSFQPSSVTLDVCATPSVTHATVCDASSSGTAGKPTPISPTSSAPGVASTARLARVTRASENLPAAALFRVAADEELLFVGQRSLLDSLGMISPLTQESAPAAPRRPNRRRGRPLTRHPRG
jgi:hypothetical protein